MVLDAQRVLADEVAPEGVDHPFDRFRIPPASGLPETGQPGVGVDLHQVVAADVEGFETIDFHGCRRFWEQDRAAVIARGRGLYYRPCQPAAKAFAHGPLPQVALDGQSGCL